jgi:transcriptional regulator GlxA family with amidase domain
MMLAWIEERFGEEVAREIAEGMIRDSGSDLFA